MDIRHSYFIGDRIDVIESLFVKALEEMNNSVLRDGVECLH